VAEWAPLFLRYCSSSFLDMASGKSTGPAKQPKFSLKRKHTSSQGERDTKKARVVSEATKSPKAKRVESIKKATAPLPNKGKGNGKELPIFKADSKVKPAKPPKTRAPDAPTPLPRAFKVITGSYEKLLYGLQGSVTLSDDGELRYSLNPVFIFPAHVSAVKAVAASPAGGKWLATGSADEIIKVWDLRRRKEVGGLMHHSGM
jgi:protein MAK11